MNIIETQNLQTSQNGPSSPLNGCQAGNGSIHGSSDSGNLSGTEHQDDDVKIGQLVNAGGLTNHVMRAGQKRTPAEIEEAVMRKKLRNRESAQRARDRQKARMRWLEEEVTRITGKNDQMMKENLLLRHVLEEQAGKINELVRRDENRRNKKLKDEVKTEPVEEIKKSAPKKSVWRPGFDDDKEDTATIISSAPTVSAVSAVTAPTASSDLQLRLNLPTLPTVTATPTPQATSAVGTLPYAAMLEQHSRSSTLPSALPSSLPFYNLAGLAAHGAYNSLATSTLANASFNR